MTEELLEVKKTKNHLPTSAEEVIQDYHLAFRSRQVSLIGRREVLSGKAKFGIFGDGKELAQIAMAKVFQKGDFRSGYYRDQTLMLALNELSIKEFFAQLYANTDLTFEPATAGRSMNAHFATRQLKSGWQLEGPADNTQFLSGFVSNRLANAAPGRARLRLAPVSRAEGIKAVYPVLE